MDPADDIHPLLRSRWSPRAFDAAAQVSESRLLLLLEAARWAPSAGNSQPWAFVTGRRGDEVHKRIVPYLAGSSGWAADASVLVLNLCHRYVAGTGGLDAPWEYSEFAHYDLGQAVAHLTVQAQALGLAVRQFRGFDRAGLATEFSIAPEWEVTTMSAIGVPASAAPGRGQRRALDDVRWQPPA